MVNAVQAKWVEKLPPLPLARCYSILAAAMLTVFVPVAAVAYAWRGPDAVLASIVAVSVCGIGSALALGATWLVGRDGGNGPLYVMLAGLVFNCMLPFAVGLVLYKAGGVLAQSGVFGQIVVFFQCALLIETVLALCLLKSPR